jgi:hypothetical protein
LTIDDLLSHPIRTHAPTTTSSQTLIPTAIENDTSRDRDSDIVDHPHDHDHDNNDVAHSQQQEQEQEQAPPPPYLFSSDFADLNPFAIPAAAAASVPGVVVAKAVEAKASLGPRMDGQGDQSTPVLAPVPDPVPAIAPSSQVEGDSAAVEALPSQSEPQSQLPDVPHVVPSSESLVVEPPTSPPVPLDPNAGVDISQATLLAAVEEAEQIAAAAPQTTVPEPAQTPEEVAPASAAPVPEDSAPALKEPDVDAGVEEAQAVPVAEEPSESIAPPAATTASDEAEVIVPQAEHSPVPVNEALPGDAPEGIDTPDAAIHALPITSFPQEAPKPSPLSVSTPSPALASAPVEEPPTPISEKPPRSPGVTLKKFETRYTSDTPPASISKSTLGKIGAAAASGPRMLGGLRRKSTKDDGTASDTASVASGSGTGSVGRTGGGPKMLGGLRRKSTKDDVVTSDSASVASVGRTSPGPKMLSGLRKKSTKDKDDGGASDTASIASGSSESPAKKGLLGRVTPIRRGSKDITTSSSPSASAPISSSPSRTFTRPTPSRTPTTTVPSGGAETNARPKTKRQSTLGFSAAVSRLQGSGGGEGGGKKKGATK